MLVAGPVHGLVDGGERRSLVRVLPEAQADELPIADSGRGTLDAVVAGPARTFAGAACAYAALVAMTCSTRPRSSTLSRWSWQVKQASWTPGRMSCLHVRGEHTQRNFWQPKHSASYSPRELKPPPYRHGRPADHKEPRPSQRFRVPPRRGRKLASKPTRKTPARADTATMLIPAGQSYRCLRRVRRAWPPRSLVDLDRLQHDDYGSTLQGTAVREARPTMVSPNKRYRHTRGRRYRHRRPSPHLVPRTTSRSARGHGAPRGSACANC